MTSIQQNKFWTILEPLSWLNLQVATRVEPKEFSRAQIDGVGVAVDNPQRPQRSQYHFKVWLTGNDCETLLPKLNQNETVHNIRYVGQVQNSVVSFSNLNRLIIDVCKGTCCWHQSQRLKQGSRATSCANWSGGHCPIVGLQGSWLGHLQQLRKLLERGSSWSRSGLMPLGWQLRPAWPRGPGEILQTFGAPYLESWDGISQNGISDHVWLGKSLDNLILTNLGIPWLENSCWKNCCKHMLSKWLELRAIDSQAFQGWQLHGERFSHSGSWTWLLSLVPPLIQCPSCYQIAGSVHHLGIGVMVEGHEVNIPLWSTILPKQVVSLQLPCCLRPFSEPQWTLHQLMGWNSL